MISTAAARRPASTRRAEAAATRRFDVTVVGGFGHVGLPLAIALASAGVRTCAFDIDAAAFEKLNRREMPFQEAGCADAMGGLLDAGLLCFSTERNDVRVADAVVIIVGTPVDRHLNPEFESMRGVIASYLDLLVDGQTIILRSTVYPGTTQKIQRWIDAQNRTLHVAFCPERIAEGHALEELRSLPQIVSACTQTGLRKVTQLFGILTSEIVILDPIEAELAKLFSNAWRYMQFAAANQFFMIASDHGADFHRIHHAMTYKYARSKGLPGPGFAAGPCLFKDTMQLAAFNNNNFYLGHAAMLINEGLPNYLVDKLKRQYDLPRATVGILGMAFKADIDDPRESLSFKLRKILSIECKEVLCSDPHVRNPGFVPAEELLDKSDIVILGAPHTAYRALRLPANKPVVDVWNFWQHGCVL